MASPRHLHGFTMIELLVVIVIVGLIAAATLPTVVSMAQGQPVTAAAQLVQASLVGVRDAASSGAVRGVRLAPEAVTRLADGSVDPSQPLVCSRLVPLAMPPVYREGTVNIFPADAYPAAITGGRPCLVLEQSPGHWEPSGAGYVWLANPPTSWSWNIRAGEGVKVGAVGEYTVCGPMAVLPGDGNPEQFVNFGPPGSRGLPRTYTAPDGTTAEAEAEILLLVNGRDDDGDGYTDEGWDGLDNDGDGLTDEPDEWEVERWHDPQSRGVANEPYRISRRVAPAIGPPPVELPSGSVIDLTGWAGAMERSRCLVNRYSGAVDLIIGQSGGFAYDLPYSGPSSLGMDLGAWCHLWIGGREDIATPATPMPPPRRDAKLLTISRAGLVSILGVDPDAPPPTRPGELPAVHLQARQGAR